MKTRPLGVHTSQKGKDLDLLFKRARVYGINMDGVGMTDDISIRLCRDLMEYLNISKAGAMKLMIKGFDFDSEQVYILNWWLSEI